MTIICLALVEVRLGGRTGNACGAVSHGSRHELIVCAFPYMIRFLLSMFCCECLLFEISRHDVKGHG